MKMKMKNSICMIILSVLTLILCACMGAQNQNFIQTDADYSDLTIKETTELKYAKNFKIDKCDGDEGYMLITIGKDVYSDDSVNDCDRFLYVPENEGVPKNVPDDVTVLKAPLDNTYLVSTSAMDLIVAAGALSDIRLSGTKADNYDITLVPGTLNVTKRHAMRWKQEIYYMQVNTVHRTMSLLSAKSVIWLLKTL